MNNQFQGWFGERATAWGLSQGLDPQVYSRLDDVIIPGGTVGTAQIDHVIISAFGVFVIETKNRTGLIHGNLGDLNWKQISGGKVYEFQNPIRQNENHITALVRLTSLPRWAFHSIIYFCGTARFAQTMPPNVRTEGITTIVHSKNTAILWPDETEHVWRKLCACKTDPNLSLERHVQNIIVRQRLSNPAGLQPRKSLPNIKNGFSSPGYKDK